MNKKVENIVCIVSIDRIEISLPINSLNKFKWNFTGKLNSKCKTKNKKFLIRNFIRNGNQIQIITPVKIDNNVYNQRYYVQLLHPDAETQRYVKELTQEVSRINMFKQFNPSIKQLEVSYDFFSKSNDTDDAVYDLYDLFSHHLCMKYSRRGSVGSAGKRKITSYRARSSNGRKSDIESKCYIKDLPYGSGTKTACRLEVQLNGKGVRDRKITIDDLPLEPGSFKVLDHFEVLDNISFQGILNISRSISRKKGAVYNRKAKNSMKAGIHTNILQRKVNGSWLEDDFIPVPEQIDRFKELAKRYELVINPKKYCQPLFNLSETVADLLDHQQAGVKANAGTEWINRASEAA